VVAVVVELLVVLLQVDQVVVEQDLLEMLELKQRQELQTLVVVEVVEQEQIAVVEIMVDQEL
jgi:cell division FtsZ-interacting protein ZapD